MRQIYTGLLSRSYRLGKKIVKRRGAPREGNQISIFFRYIFEHKHIKRVLGSQIALAIVATSLLPVPVSYSSGTQEQLIISSNEVNLKTEAHIQLPLAHPTVNQGYFFFHPGIDFEGTTGDPIKPIMAGEVESIQYSRYAYGNAIIIRHGETFSSLYAHLSKIYVEKGQKVELNTIIGEVGSTGRSSGDHLHLELMENGRHINPWSMLPRL